MGLFRQMREREVVAHIPAAGCFDKINFVMCINRVEAMLRGQVPPEVGTGIIVVTEVNACFLA